MPHPEVWLLVGGITALCVYAVRVIGPKAVPAGTPAVTAAQKRWFALGIVLLWLAADWPMHDIGEQYLYSVHMLQHLLLTSSSRRCSCWPRPSGWPASCSARVGRHRGSSSWPARCRPR